MVVVTNVGTFGCWYRVPDRRIFSNVHRNHREIVRSPSPDAKDQYSKCRFGGQHILEMDEYSPIIASEGCAVDLVLAVCKCGGPFTTSVCSKWKLSALYNQVIMLHM